MRYLVAPAVLAAALLFLVAVPDAAADSLVPDVVGLEVEKARAHLEEAGFTVALRHDADQPAGVVFDQEPGGLSSRAAGTRIVLHVGGTPSEPGAAEGPDTPAPAGEAERRPVPADDDGLGPPPGGSPPPPELDGAQDGAAPEAPTPETPVPGDGLGAPPGGALPPDPLGPSPAPPTPEAPRPASPSTPAPDEARTPGVSEPVPLLPERPGPTPAGAPPALGDLPFAPRLDRAGPEVPAVLGQRRGEARAALVAWNIREELTLAVPSLVDTVINQWPIPGRTLGEGETVIVQVGVAQPPSARHRSVPPLLGKRPGDVERILERHGFTAILRKVRSRPERAGTGVWQQPMPGSLAVVGSPVIVHFGIGTPAAPRSEGAAPRTPGAAPEPARATGSPDAGSPSLGPTEPGPMAPPAGATPPDPLGPESGPEAPTPAPERPGEDRFPDMPPAGVPPMPPLGDTPQPTGPPPADTPPAGAPDEPMPPTEPEEPTEPTEPTEPEQPARPDTPRQPEPTKPPVDPAPSGPSLSAPTLLSPPEGESYPQAYGATFEWSAVKGATGYTFLLEAEQPSGAWRQVQQEELEQARYRPERIEKGRYRWRVRATRGADAGAWSGWFRLYIYRH